MTHNELIAYARKRYGTEPEYLWESAPNTFVLRHRGNRKWYAVVMDVRRDRLGLPDEEKNPEHRKKEKADQAGTEG